MLMSHSRVSLPSRNRLEKSKGFLDTGSSAQNYEANN